MKANTAAAFQYYQSANTNFEEIKQNFVVRIKEFELIRSDLFDDEMIESVQHFLILGRRGSGKSTLLKRIECEVSENEILKKKYISINFAEEQASIHRLFDLLEEIIKALKCNGFDNLPDTDLMDIPDDYSEYSRKLFQIIQNALHPRSKKLLLLIDNIDKIFLGIKEDAKLLREILLNFDDIKIIGGSTRMSEHFWQYDLPFYQFFRILRLEALSSDEIKNLLNNWSQRLQIKELEDFVKTKPGQLEAIRILTDGLPRTLQFFVDLLINRPQQNGYAYIQKIMDMVTPLYQERLNNLLPIEQKIVLKLAFIWEAASIRDLVKPTKIESKLLSANLKKLSDNKIVDTIATSKKNHLYRLSERFFNMWLIVTQGNPMEKRKARWLTIFIENFYDKNEIKQIVQKHYEDLKSGNLKEDHLTLLTKALAQSKYTSFAERDLLISQNLSIPTLNESLKSTLPSTSSEIIEKIQNLLEEQKFREAFEEVANIPNEIDGVKDFLFGMIYQMEGNFKKSEKYYKDAFEKGEGRALSDLAVLYYDHEKYTLAEECFLKSVEEGIENAVFNLAVFYHKREKFDLAEENYLKTIEKGYEKAFFNLALIYDNQEKFELAEEYYLKAIEKGNEEAFSFIALFYDSHKRYDMAEKYYLKAIEIGNEDLFAFLALLYDNQEKYDLAEKYYLMAIEKGNQEALFNLALLYNNQEKLDLAEEYYLSAIEKGFEKALNSLAILYKNQKKYDLAEKYYLMSIEKGNESAILSLADLYNDQNIHELAEKYYKLSIEKGNKDAILSLAINFLDQNKFEFAENYFLSILNNQSDNSKEFIDLASWGIAILYDEMEKYDLAEKYYLISVENGNKSVVLSLAYLYYMSIKNNKKLNNLFLNYELGESAYERQVNILYNLWNGNFQNISNKVTDLVKEEDGIDEMFLTHLLVHYQKNLVWKLFNDPETGVLLKNKFAPLYFATSILIDNEESKLNLLKTPPEIEETVNDILNKIENLRKEYYPES